MKTVLKWIGILVVLLVVAVGAMYVIGGSKVNAMVEVPAETLAVMADSASLAHGAYLAATHGCTGCHTANLGGQVFIDAPPFLIVASNLTPAGVGATYTDADWERAIRHGVGPDGRGLAPMMPSGAYTHLSDGETAALIAYLKSVPAVENDLPTTEVRAMGRIIAATGGLPLADAKIDHARAHPATAPAPGPTMEYGIYRAGVLCTYCHGADLHGGPPLGPDAPAATDLYVVTGWSLDEFVQVMRTGVTPSGKQLNPETMPWDAFSHMTDDELQALYMHLSTLTPAEATTAQARISR